MSSGFASLWLMLAHFPEEQVVRRKSITILWTNTVEYSYISKH
jgi:hypothetical protein